MKFRTQYDLDAAVAAGEAAITYNNDEPLTQQQFAKDADLNEIIRRMGGIEQLPAPQALSPDYFGDFSNVPDLRTALELVRDAEHKFRTLPVDLRARFDNDPARLWQWVNDGRNHEQAVELGLLSRKAAPAPSRPATEPQVPPVTS